MDKQTPQKLTPVTAAVFIDKASDFAGLKSMFCEAAEAGGVGQSRSFVLVRDQTLARYLNLYEASWVFHDALRAVCADGEHQLLMEEAQSMGYRLPLRSVFEEELDDYKEFLGSIALVQRPAREEGVKSVAMKSARDLNRLMSYNCFMLSRTFSNVFKSDYLKHFTYLKQSGAGYAGSAALQEAVDLLTVMTRVKRGNELDVRSGIMRAEWPALIAQ